MSFFLWFPVCFSHILSLLLNSNSSYSSKHIRLTMECGGVEFGTKLLETSAYRWGPTLPYISKIPSGMDIYTRPNVKQIASGKQPHSTGRSARCFVST